MNYVDHGAYGMEHAETQAELGRPAAARFGGCTAVLVKLKLKDIHVTC